MTIEYSKSAIKSLRALNESVRKRIVNAIEMLPEGDVKKLKGFTFSFRLRVGDYRILYEHQGYNIKITDVLPRGDAYKK